MYLKYPLDESTEFIAVETNGEKINFTTDRVKCLNCQKNKSDPYGLVFPAGKDIDFIITSDKLIINIKFTEQGNKVADFIFLEMVLIYNENIYKIEFLRKGHPFL